ncbi:MAG: YkgJ family cysteine cluster protein [Oleispira antarctica]|nr:YkgJ family cysteine cluster protein [Oleispira antarctica]MBQ0793584.1 YkgJ family cysteine cluster protein [Oleispira antarctica]
MKECNSCGKCCIKYSNGGLSASKQEIELWEVFTPTIAEYVHKGEIWADPKTGKLLELCPFLRLETSVSSSRVKYSCDIYFDRPDDCKYYPSNVQEMILDGCEMIEASDLKNLKRAQAKLDIIMTDSRS